MRWLSKPLRSPEKQHTLAKLYVPLRNIAIVSKKCSYFHETLCICWQNICIPPRNDAHLQNFALPWEKNVFTFTQETLRLLAKLLITFKHCMCWQNVYVPPWNTALAVKTFVLPGKHCICSDVCAKIRMRPNAKLLNFFEKLVCMQNFSLTP